MLYFRKCFAVLKQCVEFRLIDREEIGADSSYTLASVSRNSWIDVEEKVTQSMQSYFDCLDEELSQLPGFKNPP